MKLSFPAFAWSRHTAHWHWLAVWTFAALPARALPLPGGQETWPGGRWTLTLPADDHAQASLALRLAPALQAGATLALPRAQGVPRHRLAERAAMAWVDWTLQPAGWRRAQRDQGGSRPASVRPGMALQWHAGLGATLTPSGFDGYDRRAGGPALCTTAQPFAGKRWRLKMKLQLRF